jgi:hypothetical protein
MKPEEKSLHGYDHSGSPAAAADDDDDAAISTLFNFQQTK